MKWWNEKQEKLYNEGIWDENIKSSQNLMKMEHMLKVKKKKLGEMMKDKYDVKIIDDFKIWNENGTPKIDHLPSPSCWGTVPEHKGARVGVEGDVVW